VTYLNSETEGFVMDDLGNRTGIQTLRGGGTDDYSVDSLSAESCLQTEMQK
jgi:hypothetical protein